MLHSNEPIPMQEQALIVMSYIENFVWEFSRSKYVAIIIAFVIRIVSSAPAAPAWTRRMLNFICWLSTVRHRHRCLHVLGRLLLVASWPTVGR